MALAKDAIRSARTYLNDLNGITWSDAILMPLLQEAHGELIQELELNNTGVVKAQTSPTTVTAGSLGITQPSGLINPIEILEGDVNAAVDTFVSLEKVSFIPLVPKTTNLIYWAWIDQVITFLGATTDRQIILRYEGTLSIPQTLNDQ